MKSFTLQDFNTLYPDDSACLRILFNNRYGNLKSCPKCKKKTKFYLLKKRRMFSCKHCGHQIAPTAGTIFHRSKTPLKSWFFALYLFANSKNGVAAMELQRHIGVTYKTAWRMCSQIRKLFVDNKEKLKGIVEMDETFYGGKGWNKRFRFKGEWESKECLFGMVEREGSVRALHIQTNDMPTLISETIKNVDRDSMVMTDEFLAYKALPKYGYKHETILHKKHYVDGPVYTNNIENFWSQLKRSLNGTYHSVSKKYLQSYVNEFAFRYNHRRNGKELLSLMISKASKQV